MQQNNQTSLQSGLKWRLFAGENIPDGLFDHGDPVGDVLNLPDGRTISAREFAFPESGIVDMWSILGYHPTPMCRTVLTADFEETAPALRIIGFGCDWEMELRLNGEVVYSTRSLGNGESHVNPNNHILQIQTRQGHNQFVYELFCGELTFDVAFKLLDLAPLALRYEPWVQYPDAATNAISIAYTANRKTPAGLDYRIKGDESWTRVYDNLGGQIRRDRAEHVIRLEDLRPDTAYEYRVVLVDESRSYFEYALPNIYHFRTAPKHTSDFSFVTTSDLQIPYSKRVAFLNDLLARADSKAADFVAFLGDVSWTSDFDLDVIEGFVMPFQTASNFDKTLVMVRGNHEIYGQDTNRFFSYFNAPEPGRDGYTMFRWGDVCFFILDFCDDDGRNPHQSSRALHDFEPYLAHEGAWLKRMVETPECKNAKYRIVLAHGLPLGDLKEYMPDHVRKIIDPVFGGPNPVCRIHLWLGGHVHYPLRTIPLKNAWYCQHDLLDSSLHLPAPARLGEKYPFTVAVHSGPLRLNPKSLQASSMLIQVSDAGIEVKASDMTGAVYDQFRINEDGDVEEIFRAASFKYFEY